MAQRFCPRCNAEVEDTGGYCLLGHDLRLEAPVDSLKALRAEVNRTFDEARRELADVMAPAAVLAPASAEAQAQESPGHAGETVRLDEALVIEGADDVREWSDARAGGTYESAGAPEPPVPVAHVAGSVWHGLDEAESLNPGDPIATFAPSPRMDWGPRRSRFGRRPRADEQHADV